MMEMIIYCLEALVKCVMGIMVGACIMMVGQSLKRYDVRDFGYTLIFVCVVLSLADLVFLFILDPNWIGFILGGGDVQA